MAQVIDNAKGFKVIEMSLPESVKAFGGVGACDSCNRAAYTAYYIAVLNEAFCPYCYEEWQKHATRYEEDAEIEQHNFDVAKNMLRIR